ncbi:MAG: carbohydrate kinase family protein [Methanocellales archaeon]|nr:carbohydrate kinase family protein [Methanocellales archaeon]MDD3292210.1 carbohydrate kinase family protein [Methanocellales archaeon]MDD5235723.1 carbohydrate kinase family protein [Methanocellales archaeon]MDD5485788.1 carbohydrate kinase family protein [Methanocellales archaeon]
MDVFGLGALNYDKLYVVTKIAKAGEEVGIKEVRESPGGSAANTIFGLARVGVKTGFVGVVGNDEEGGVILRDLANEGVDINRIKVLKGNSGLAIGLVDDEGERSLYIYPGVNDEFDVSDVDVEYMGEAKFLHMSSFVDRRQLEMQISLIERIKTGVSFNPGMSCSKFSLETLQPIIEKSEVIFVNYEEMGALTNSDYEEGSKLLLELGTRTVATTLGRRGCYVTNGKSAHLISSCKTRVVDTTGAGDAFAAGFLYGLLGGEDIHNCGKMGNFFAARCISEYGARKGLPHKRDLEIAFPKR